VTQNEEFAARRRTEEEEKIEEKEEKHPSRWYNKRFYYNLLADARF